MKKQFRITFSDGPMGKRMEKHYDVWASDIGEAEKIGFDMSTARQYCNMSVQEVPMGPKMVGLEILYEDTYLKKNYHAYIIIRANDESSAVDYYNKHLKGGRFWFDAGKTDDLGKCVRGAVVNTYYAACPGCDFDIVAEKGE